MRTTRRRAGFTLIELLVVVLIIGILATFAISKFGQSKRRAFLSAMQSDLRTLALEAESRYATDGSYVGVVAPTGTKGVQLSITSTLTSWKGTATHAGMPGVVCTIESLPGASAMRPEPVCN